MQEIEKMGDDRRPEPMRSHYLGLVIFCKDQQMSGDFLDALGTTYLELESG